MNLVYEKKEALTFIGFHTEILYDKGCAQFASDCELDNDLSRHFHLGTGFREANRIICFTKKL